MLISPDYTKHTYVFTASGYSENYISSSSPTFTPIDHTTDTAYTFTIGTDNSVTTKSSFGTFTNTIRISGDWLNLGAGATKSN